MSKELEALENIKRDLEYITRLDYVDPIVRGEVRDELYKIYHRELPELDIIETALKNYEKLTSKPAILYGRTHGHTQALVDTICKNYKEVKITNLEDEKKLKALDIIKEKNVWFWVFRRTHNVNEYNEKVALYYPECDELTQEEYDILKEVML